MNFLYTRERALHPDVCALLIDAFESSQDLHLKGITAQGFEPEHKSDTEIRIEPSLFSRDNWASCLTSVFFALQGAISEYKKQSTGLDLLASWGLLNPFNMQRYMPGEGYPSPHCEVGGDSHGLSRVLTWILYLNTVTDLGGTRFPNQDCTINAEQGKLLIAPAYWTHTHYGVISPTQTKYILTGWYGFL